jgi:serine O-acetyltransferase
MAEKVLMVHRFGKKLSNAGYPRAARLVSILIRIVFSAEIPSTCEIGHGVKIKHGGLGVVIHDRAVVGDGTIIFHHVTIGGREKSGTPVIGKNVYIGCGACILGNVYVGDNARIGANTVVIKDVESGTTVIGIPARVVKRDEVLV